MQKLLTVGCSYTNYWYPTWASWLGTTFPQFENLGESGSGPLFAYTQINDYFNYGGLRKSKIKAEDHVVIIQWSSLLRHDMRFQNGNWVLGGQIDNNYHYTQDYLKLYFNTLDSASNLNNYINHMLLLSKELGFKLKMCYMFEPWINQYLGEPVGSIKIVRENINLVKRSNYIQSLKEHVKQDYWINPSIELTCLQNPSKYKIKQTAQYNDKPCYDHHPTIGQHLLYARMIGKLFKKELDPNFTKVADRADEFISGDYNDQIFRNKGCQNINNLLETFN